MTKDELKPLEVAVETAKDLVEMLDDIADLKLDKNSREVKVTIPGDLYFTLIGFLIWIGGDPL